MADQSLGVSPMRPLRLARCGGCTGGGPARLGCGAPAAQPASEQGRTAQRMSMRRMDATMAAPRSPSQVAPI